jgi:hypothetical protein
MKTISAEEFEKQYGSQGVKAFTAPTPKKEGFVSNVSNAFNKRVDNAAEAQVSTQNPASKVLQTLGQGAGFVGDLGIEAVKAVTPDAVEDVVSSGIEHILAPVAQTRAAQGLSEWAKAHPEAAKNLEAIFNIAGLVPVGKGADVAAKVGVKAASKTAGGAADAAIVAGRAAKTVAKGTNDALTTPLKPENIMQRVARLPKGAQAKFEKTSGESVGAYLTKRGIFGDTENISQQLYKRFSQSKDTADAALAQLPGRYNPTPLRTALKELLERETRVSSPGALSKDFKRTRELNNKLNKGGLDMSEINEVKRIYERNVRLDFVKQNLPEGVARSTNLDNALREWQFTQAKKLGLNNLPDINKETRLAKQLLDAIGKETAGSLGNNALTLTDYILLAGGDPTAVSAFFGKKVLSSKAVQSAIAKKLYKGPKVASPKAQFGKPKPGLEDFMSR